MSESESDSRRLMGGIALLRTQYTAGQGWELAAQAGITRPWERALPGWTIASPISTESVRLYTDIHALPRDHPEIFQSGDVISFSRVPGANTCQVRSMVTHLVALAVIPADAGVRTSSWEMFVAPTATIRNLAPARKDGLATTPLRELIAAGRIDPPAPLAELGQFEVPILDSLLQRWNAAATAPPVRKRSVEFVAATDERLAVVSRAHAILKLIHENRDAARDFSRDIVEGLPQILNHADDADTITWVLEEIVKPTLDVRRPVKSEIYAVPNRDIIYNQLQEVNSPGLRQRVEKLVREGAPKPPRQLRQNFSCAAHPGIENLTPRRPSLAELI